MRIAVCLPQVPFARGGAEILAERLVEELAERGHDADLVTVPFKWYPGARALSEAFVWRLLDLEEAEARPIDLVIATKFPSYVVRHRNKVVWLIAQLRQAYDLDRTSLGQFGESRVDRATRRAIHRLDRLALGEARRLFAISGNVANRLQQSLGMQAEVLVPPPQKLDYRCEDYGDFVLSVGRLDRMKRVDLLLEAASGLEELTVVIVGAGPQREELEKLASKRGLDGRVTFTGRIEPDELAGLYARCLGVFYAPIDEDLGFVPYEAFLAEKPVITTHDAGGPLDAVANHRTGLVCEPTAAAVREACMYLAAHRDDARAWGRHGRKLAEAITWDAVVERLLAA